MPKAGEVRKVLDAIAAYLHGRTPQKGMFSTLDEMIQEAPFEKGTGEQWAGYLKPGRPLRREGAEFPLKKEELEWSGLSDLLSTSGLDYTKDNLLSTLRSARPRFGLTLGDQDLYDLSTASNNAGPFSDEYRKFTAARDPYGQNSASEFRLAVNPPKYGPSSNFDDGDVGDSRLSHTSRGSKYQESMTRMPGTIEMSTNQHFAPDTVSHSRTSSHDIPDLGKVRLVEEIQSDLHERAAERHIPFHLRGEDNEGWMHFATPEERARSKQIDRELNAIPNDQKQRISDLIDEGHAIHEAAMKRAPRRGYQEVPTDEIDRRQAELNERWDNGRLARRSPAEQEEWRQAQEELSAMIQQNRESAPNAPFKNPADYGRLELKKQLLSAVNNDQDYLAMVRGDDQIRRYGMEGGHIAAGETTAEDPNAAGMRYVYDKIYRGEMEKLAKQYGAKVEDIKMPLGAAEDWRPDIMREYELETPQDFYEYMTGRLLSPTSSTADLDASMIDHSIDAVKNMLDNEVAVNPDSDYDQILKNLNKVRRNVVEAHDSQLSNRMPDAKWTDDMVDLWDSTMAGLKSHLENHRRDMTMENRMDAKTFPAIKLTPEVKKRIKELGVPLWTAAGAGTGLEMMNQDEQKPEGFAEGGKVDEDEKYGETSDLLKRLWTALRTQWSGLDEKGDPVPFLHYGEDVDLSNIDPETGMPLAPMKAEMPGLAMNTLALPGMVGVHNDFIDAQGRRYDELENRMRDLEGLSPPDTFAEHLATEGGNMLGQAPLPLFGEVGEGKGVLQAIKDALRYTVKHPGGAAKKVVKGIPRAGYEWLTPTVDPRSPMNYVAPAAFGAGLGTLGDHLSEKDTEQQLEDLMREQQTRGE